MGWRRPSERYLMAEEWKFRPGTLDEAIFNGVVCFNEYQLPSRFAAGDIVIDIGAHIGSFAHAATPRRPSFVQLVADIG